MGVWKQVTSQVGDIFKGAAKQIVAEPLEMGQSAVSQVMGDSGSSDNKAMEMLEVAQTTAAQAGQASSDMKNGGFKTPADLHRYEELSGRKDEIELNQIRAKLVGEFGLETNIDQGMARARSEFEQKEEERKKVVEQKKQEEDWMVEKKKQEDMAVTAAKGQSSAENKAWGAG